MSSGIGFVLLTTFLASSVEAIEMVTIVVGVGATRGWRATLIGTVAGFLVLAVVVAVFGLAIAFFSPHPVSFFITTLAFATYLVVRLAEAIRPRLRARV